GNGIFDADDYLLAYVTGVCDWYYDTASRDYDYNFNHYESYRYYWLKKGGSNSTIKQFNCNAVPSITLSQFLNRVRYKQSNELMWTYGGKPKGGLEWIWIRLNKYLMSFPYTLTFPDVDTNTTGYIKIVSGSTSNNCSTSVSFGDSLLYDSCAWKPITNWCDSVLTIKLTIKLADRSDYFELKHLDVKYWRHLDMSGKKSLRIYSPLDSGIIVAYQLSNLPSERTFIFRIPSDELNISLVNIISTGGSYSWTDTAGIGIQYFVCA
ncbi:unnamed protein product, partial [marine sediment metagenome]